MLWGRRSPSLYREALREFAAERDEVTVFSEDPEEREGELHYLRFAEEDGKSSFDLTLHNVDDGPEFAASFPYLARCPGVIFFGDIFLHGYARATSHSALDGWGYRWIVGVACPDQADSLARLADEGYEPGALARTVPLARALAVRSAAAVVPDFNSQRLLGEGEDMPPVSVIPPPGEKELGGGSQGEFPATLERMIPKWVERAVHAEWTIAPLDHPHRDLPAVERARVSGRFAEEDGHLAAKALERLEELFGM